MKYNKIVNESDVKNKNTFLVACVCSILLLLTMCYFGVNSTVKGTAAATLYTCDGGETTQTSSTCTETLSFAYDYNRSGVCNWKLGTGWSGECDVTSVDEDEDGERDYYQYECTCTKSATFVSSDVNENPSCSDYSGDESACTAAGCNYVSYSGVCNGTLSGDEETDDDSTTEEEWFETITGDDCEKTVLYTTYPSCELRFGSDWTGTSQIATSSDSIIQGFYHLYCQNTACDEDEDTSQEVCWQCNSNGNLKSWGVSGGDGCPSGWHQYTATEEDCVSTTYEKITCAAGYYYNGTTDKCEECLAGKYCSGGEYDMSGVTQGSTTCPTGTTSSAGGDSHCVTNV